MHLSHITVPANFMLRLLALSIAVMMSPARGVDAVSNDHLGAEYASEPGQDQPVAGAEGRAGEQWRLPLGGTWNCRLDRQDAGVNEGWFTQLLTATTAISLPGTLAQAGLGDKIDTRSRFGLTPKIRYVGKAWYQREIDIPETWRNKTIVFFFERCGWESRLWVDGQPVGVRDSLSTPHIYDWPAGLTPGKHTITLRLDSQGRPGASCHGWGIDTQLPWNGVLGQMYLSAHDPVWTEHVGVRAEANAEQGARAHITVRVRNDMKATMDGAVNFSIRRKGTEKFAPQGEAFFKSGDREFTISTIIPIEKAAALWDEFSPQLYELQAEVRAQGEGRKTYDRRTVEFGIRSLGTDNAHLTVNGRRVFLRGTHDGCAFPLTGGMATSVEEWRRIFRTVKSYGLNHVRYHSVCPPGGAFQAADEEGVYIQAELPYWGRVRNGWAGSSFLRTELDRILEAYGNHPSFILMSMGNEHSGDWDLLQDFVDHAKRQDPRRLYASTSNAYIYPGTRQGFPFVPGDQFWVSMYAGMPQEGSRTRARYMELLMVENEAIDRAADYSDIYAGSPMPGFSHELGQFWFFPNLDERSKYTGVQEARNFDIFHENLEQAGLLSQAPAFFRSSGASALNLYKEEIERQLRTPECGGFQLLDLHDYPGQGTALVGILDVFWESKGLIEPEQFRRFCDNTVLLARPPKAIWFNNEKAVIPMEIYHYGPDKLDAVAVDWELTDRRGQRLQSGRLGPPVTVPTGTVQKLSAIDLDLTRIEQPQELTLRARLAGTGIGNDWRIWCYPSTLPSEPASGQLLTTADWTGEALPRLQAGGTVLFLAHESLAAAHIDAANAIWTPWNNIPTCGMLIQEEHPAFAGFPTSYFTDWQWWDLLEPYARAVIVPKGIALTPIAQPIDEPIRALKLATIFEAKVGNGRLLATSLDLVNSLETRPGARQLRASLIQYAMGPGFAPVTTLTAAEATRILQSSRFSQSTAPPRPEPGRIVLAVEASVNAPANAMSKWERKFDRATVQLPGYDWTWQVSDANRWGGIPNVSWNRGNQTCWMTRKDKLQLTVPKDFEGTLHLFFHDRSDGKRRGQVQFLRECAYLGTHDGAGKWLAINIAAGEAKDGEILLTFSKPAGGDTWSTSPTIEKLLLLQNADN